MASLVGDVQGCLQSDILIHTSWSLFTNRIYIGESWKEKHTFFAVVILWILQSTVIIKSQLYSICICIFPSALHKYKKEKKKLG